MSELLKQSDLDRFVIAREQIVGVKEQISEFGEFTGTDEQMEQARNMRLAVGRARLDFEKEVKEAIAPVKLAVKEYDKNTKAIVADFKAIESDLKSKEDYAKNLILEKRKQRMLEEGVVSMPAGVDILEIDDENFEELLKIQVERMAAAPKVETASVEVIDAAPRSASSDREAIGSYLDHLISIAQPKVSTKSGNEVLSKVMRFLTVTKENY